MIENARLQNLFVLSHKVIIYVPATDNTSGQAIPIDNSAYVERCAIVMSNAFGGATCTDAIGYWVSPERGLERENSKMVFSYAETLDNLDAVLDIAEAIKAELAQDSVAVEIDGMMYFV